jgi:hypothetical protein
VLPSMSVKRKVTVPEGRSGMISLESTFGRGYARFSHGVTSALVEKSRLPV